MTSIFVTHDQEEAMRISDTIHIMNNGQIEQSGRPLEIYTQPKTLFTASFIGNYNILAREDFKTIFKEKVSGDYIAIRPEKIKLNSQLSKYRLEAELMDTITLGNTIRFILKASDLVFKVDVLNEDTHLLEVNDKLFLGFEDSDLIVLGGQNG